MLLLQVKCCSAYQGDSSVRTLEGREVSNFKTARKISNRLRSQNDPGCLFGGIFIASFEAVKHFLVAGASGSGKTLTIRLWLESVLPNITPGSRRRMLISNPKRDVLAILHGIGVKVEVINLDPFDGSNSYGWSLCEDIRTPAHIEALAHILVPQDNSNDTFWRDCVVVLLTGVISYFVKYAPNVWTLRDILLVMENQRFLSAMLRSDPAFHSYLDVMGSEKTAANIISTIRTKLSRYKVIAALWHQNSLEGRTISLKRWSQSEAILVLGRNEEAKEAMQAVNQLLLQRLAQILINLPDQSEERPETYVVLDEFCSIGGRLPLMRELAVEGRSKGVSLFIGFQDYKDVENTYGDKIAATITSQFRHKAILRLDSPATARWAANLVGEIIVERRQTSTSSSAWNNVSVTTSWRRSKEEAIIASQFLAIPPINKDKGNGLKGFYLTGEHVYWYTYPLSYLRENLKPKAQDIGGFIERPVEHQYLQMWQKEDNERLEGISRLFFPERPANSEISLPPSVEEFLNSQKKNSDADEV